MRDVTNNKRFWCKISGWSVFWLGLTLMEHRYDLRACALMLIVCAAVALAVAAEMQDISEMREKQVLDAIEQAIEMAVLEEEGHTSCEGCKHHLGGGMCRINLEDECGKGEHEAWEGEK